MPLTIEQLLNIDTASAPSYRADGKYLAYLSDKSGVPQVWRHSAGSHTPEQLSSHVDKAAFVKYAPSGGDLIYGMDAGGDERQQLYLLADGEDSAKPLTVDPEAIHQWGGWNPNGRQISYASNSRDPEHFDGYVFDLDTMTQRQLFQGAALFSIECWSPDGRFLVVRLDLASSQIELFLVAAQGGPLRRLTPGNMANCYRNIRWKKDSSGFYLCSNEGREFSGIGFCSLEHLNVSGQNETSLKIEWLHLPDWDVETIQLSPDGRRLAYIINEEGYSKLAVIELESAQHTTVPTHPAGVIPEVVWSPDNNGLVFTLNGSTCPSNIWSWDFSSTTVFQLTGNKSSAVPRETFVEPELVRYASFDGRDIPAFLYLPANPVPRQGLSSVILVHGGPESQYLPQFEPEVQFLLQLGYAVLATNVRGSSGYGRAFMALDDVRLRMDSVKDLKHAAIWLGNQTNMNSHRIAVMGGSYGGFMVLAAITNYPDLWAAAVEFYGVVNFQTLLANTGPWRRKHRAAEYGDPVTDADFLHQISPIHHADKITAPLFVAQGLRDPRVPPGESEQIVNSLQSRGQHVEYLTFADEGHGFVKRANKLIIYRAVARFLDRYLGV